MAGPGIRVWELAHLLARRTDVTIGTPNQSSLASPHVEIRCYDGGRMAGLVDHHEVVIAFGYLLRHYPEIVARARYLVMDIYDPFVLENLHMHDELSLNDRLVVHQHDLDVVLEQLERADFLICASPRQRDFWLGALTAANRINPFTFEEDRTLRRLIDVVPFGLSEHSPQPTALAVKGVVPGIATDDVVVLWGGGIWNWFDPLTLIRAIDRLKGERPPVKAYFMGTGHPDPAMPKMAMAFNAMRLAEELGIRDRQIFFGREWVPYRERVNYLCDADIGISLHFEHVETLMSFRTRILDYLWAGLPVISTEGDTLTDTIAAAGAGISVPEGDVEAVAGALVRLSQDRDLRRSMGRRSAALSKQYTWERVALPLVKYCGQPWRAADGGRPEVARPRIGGQSMRRRMLSVWRAGGAAEIVRRLHRRIRRALPAHQS